MRTFPLRISTPSGNQQMERYGSTSGQQEFELTRTSQPVIDYPLSKDYSATWDAMEWLVDEGKAKSIGISNFSILKTKRLLESARIPPAVNQVELHP